MDGCFAPDRGKYSCNPGIMQQISLQAGKLTEKRQKILAFFASSGSVNSRLAGHNARPKAFSGADISPPASFSLQNDFGRPSGQH